MNLLTALLCSCPQAAAVTTIPALDCIEQFGQIQKFGLQRRKSGVTENVITIGSTDPADLATWTALKAAVDSTKVQFSPYIANPTNEPADPREFGGGNQTVDGIPITLGKSPSPFSCELLNSPADVYAAMNDYICETELSVFLINENGQIGGLTDSLASPTTFRGIPIRSFFISDKTFGGFEEPDRHFIRWQFAPDWSTSFYVVDTNFDALAALS